MQKILFMSFMAVHVFLYRITGGRLGGRVAGLRVLLLTTTGHKTGKERTNPLGYFEDEGNFVIIASNGGRDTHPAWFFNLKSNPQVTLQVKDKQLTATAESAAPEQRKQLWAKLLELAPGYGDYQKRTTREIPVVILRPAAKT